MDHRAQVQLSKVPGIADIPVLGQLFRSRSINRSNTELLVLVTPHIVDPVHVQTAVAAGAEARDPVSSKIPSSTISCLGPRKSQTFRHHRARNE